jgi:hypothetical protein
MHFVDGLLGGKKRQFRFLSEEDFSAGVSDSY